MRKIIVLEHISLDGVIQAPGVRRQMHMPFDLLSGRNTFEIWASFWPGVNTAIKYVASNTMTSHAWQPSFPTPTSGCKPQAEGGVPC